MGQVTTFYSYKGGVGRSMALANVAFIAAMNGARVLVMDWDLEAPGLGHYFRGLMESAEAKAYRAAPGILDLAWEWVTKVRQLKDPEQADDLVGPFLNGDRFGEAASSLIDLDLLPENARLDILRAGRDVILCPQPRSYAEALSDFDWTQFFTFDVGGLMLNALRRWAKEKYDYVLIDSRTGLADVAGVCTMQLPDDVALCFVLNRQNMEGVARVAHAIRAKREEEVKLHILPMRLASVGTSEEADAKARAKRLLTKIGNFSPDEFDEDYKTLGVQAAPSVPFYETLAPIVAPNPLTDPLSFNYLQLASQLLGRQFTMPELEDWWVDRVRRRVLSPIATADYLLQLRSTVPERAFEEITQLVDAALRTLLENEDELDDSYLEALVHAALEVAEEGDEDPDAALATLQQTADILRVLASGGSAKWRSLLVEALNRILEMPAYMDPEEELSFLEEADGLLSEDPTHAAQLQRLRHRRRSARLLINEDSLDGAGQAVSEIGELAARLEGAKLAPDQLANVHLARLEMPILRGDIQIAKGNLGRAKQEFEKALADAKKLDPKGRQSELARPRLDAHLRLATRFKTMSARARADHAMEATRWGAQINVSQFLLGQFTEIIVAANDPVLTVEYVGAMYLGERSPILIAYSSRLARTGAIFFDSTSAIVKSLAELKDEALRLSTVEELARMSGTVAKSLLRRRTMIAPAQAQHLRRSLERLTVALGENIPVEAAAELSHLLEGLHSRVHRVGPIRRPSSQSS